MHVGVNIPIAPNKKAVHENKPMKIVITTAVLLFTSCFILAQNDFPKEITGAMLQHLTAEAGQEAKAFSDRLKQQYNNQQGEFPKLSPEKLLFATDTFKIEQLARKKMMIDYSTAGMSRAISEKQYAYDILLNKYYKLLLHSLEPADKKVLIAAQKAWLHFRDSEIKLISLVSLEKYSGGGSIQSINALSAIANLTIERTSAVFNYYDEMSKTPL